MAISIAEVTFGGDGYTDIDADEEFTSALVVQLWSPFIEQAPSAIVVTVSDALSDEDIVFEIHGVEVFRAEPEEGGTLGLTSIPVPDLKDGTEHLMMPGMHTLTVTQGVAVGVVEFEVYNEPPPRPELIAEDAPPAFVPGSLQPNGVRRWVLQDLMPTGLGSWVFPMNPKTMGSPAFSRGLTVKNTTASPQQGGQFHIYEEVFKPVEWTFEGYCPSESMRDMLEAFHDLNRRLYLHDHRGRAWKIAFRDLELEPRLVEIWNGDYIQDGHDYRAVVLVLDQEFTQLAES